MIPAPRPASPDLRPRILLRRTGDVRAHLWVKALTGVDLEVHCANSLLGEYLPVNREARGQAVLLPAAPAWYFCGVTAPYVWAHNDHAVLLPAPGHRQDFSTPGYVLRLFNVTARFPLANMVPRHARHAHDPWFARCRNWQAAHWLHARGIVPTALSRAS